MGAWRLPAVHGLNRLGSLRPDSSRTVVASLFLLSAMVFGGGGSSAPASELITELLAIAAVMTWLALPAVSQARPLLRTLLTLTALVAVLPAIQLVPLPPALWKAMPGRETEAAVLALIGRSDAWMPWTISPYRTLASLLSLIPPLACLWFAASLDRRGRAALVAIIAVGGSLSLLLGALQLADGAGRTWRFYADNPGFLNGFQANRNAQADVMLIAALAVAASVASLPKQTGNRLAQAGAAAGSAILLLGCVLTGSRTGVVMIPLAAALVGLTLEPRLWRPRNLVLVVAIGLAPLLLLALALAAQNQALGAVTARFTLERDFRLELWRDTWTAVTRTWPFGSGVGTFRPAFTAAERLEVVDPTHPVRAHCDYLEFVLEGGVAAIAVLVAGGTLLAARVRKALRHCRAGEVPSLLFCIGCLGVIALHSFIDYPVRSMALACIAATAVGIVFAIGGRPQASGSGGLASG